MQAEQQTNWQVLLDPRWQLPCSALGLDRLDAALREQASALQACAASGRLLGSHSDLRSEHVCLAQARAVIDGLEVNAALRKVDAFDELGYLGLECEMVGAPRITARLLEGAPPRWTIGRVRRSCTRTPRDMRCCAPG